MSTQQKKQPIFTQDGRTNVLGYWNANSWPVQISISSLGKVFTVQPGQFIVDDQGNKFNDPTFEGYTGPGLLSREWVSAGTAVHIRRVSPPVQHLQAPQGFTGQPNFPVAQPLPGPAQAANTNKSPVSGYSIDEAKRIGLIKETKEANANAVIDSGGTPPPGEFLEEIDFAHDVPSKRVAQAPPPSPIAPKNTATLLNAPAASLPPVAPEAKVSKHVQEAFGTAEEQAAAEQRAAEFAHNMAASAQQFDPENPMLLDNVVKVAVPTTPPMSAPSTIPSLPEPTGVTESQAFPSELPQPILDDPVSDRPTALTAADAAKPFIDPVSGKGFGFRSELDRWAKRKYSPEKYSEIMAKYPRNY